MGRDDKKQETQQQGHSSICDVAWVTIKEKKKEINVGVDSHSSRTL